MAGPERIELPPPGSKPGMISISPKADVENPAVILTRAQGRAVLCGGRSQNRTVTVASGPDFKSS